MSSTPAPTDPRALLLETLQARELRAGREPIAIVGAACRFPGASTLDRGMGGMKTGEDLEALSRLMGTEVTGFPKSESVRTLRTTDFGMDSPMALEVTNRIHSESGVALPMVRFLDGRELAGQITTEAGTAKDRAAGQFSDEELLARIDQLSEAEIDAAMQRLLAEESVS